MQLVSEKGVVSGRACIASSLHPYARRSSLMGQLLSSGSRGRDRP